MSCKKLLILLVFSFIAVFSATILTNNNSKTFKNDCNNLCLAEKESDVALTFKNEKEIIINLEGKTIFSQKFSLNQNAIAFADQNNISLPSAFLELLNFDMSPEKAFSYILPQSTYQIHKTLEKYETEKQDCKITFTHNPKEPFLYSKFSDGVTVNRDKLYYLLAKNLNKRHIKANVNLEIEKCFDLDMAKSKTMLRGSFSTKYGWSNPSRKNNVEVASRKISGTVLKPGQKFSFNKKVGRRTISNGFREAPIIMDGKFILGTGGGVCQVSTTLYNTALLSGLHILVANQHSLPISYVPPSFDAMVTERSDLVFLNTSNSDIYIQSSVNGSILTFKMFGTKGKYFKTRSITTEIIPYKTKIVEDSKMKIGETKIVKKGKSGLKSEGFLDEYDENGKLIKSTKIRKNLYKPQEQVKHIGVKEFDDIEKAK